MKTPFHLKLESMCVKQRKGEQHWTLSGAATIRVPFLGGIIVTVKRALYAAFIGDIPDAYEVVENCGHKYCVRPDHQLLRYRVNGASRGLSMPNMLEALTKPNTYQEKPPESILPKGITVRKINMVKVLSRTNDLDGLRDATGLPKHEIMKIRGGSYDEAVKNIKGAGTRRRSDKDLDKYREEPAHLPDTSPQPIPTPRAYEEPTEIVGASDEEANWLAMMRTGR